MKFVRFVFLQPESRTDVLQGILDVFGLKRNEDYIVTQSRKDAMRTAINSRRPAIIFTHLGEGGLRFDDCMKMAEEVGRDVLTIGYDDQEPSVEMWEALDGSTRPAPETDYAPLQTFLANYLAGVPKEHLLLGLRKEDLSMHGSCA